MPPGKKPERMFYRAYMFKSFQEGTEAMRRKFTETELPIISRLSDEDIQRAYFRTKIDNPSLYKFLERATDDLKQNPFCGIQVPKRQIPKTYVSKYEIDNLCKYSLPDAWRLICSVAESEVEIIGILLEWFPHKEYEKRFRY